MLLMLTLSLVLSDLIFIVVPRHAGNSKKQGFVVLANKKSFRRLSLLNGITRKKQKTPEGKHDRETKRTVTTMPPFREKKDVPCSHQICRRFCFFITLAVQ